MIVRPVAARARRMAACTASDPDDVKRSRSAHGSIAQAALVQRIIFHRVLSPTGGADRVSNREFGRKAMRVALGEREGVSALGCDAHSFVVSLASLHCRKGGNCGSSPVNNKKN